MDRQEHDTRILRTDVTGRRVAAAGFGFALSLPFAASAFAMLPADGGGGPATPRPADPPKPAKSPRGQVPAATPAPDPKPAPARAPAPAPRPAPAPKPAAPSPTAAKPPVRPQQYGMDSFTYHHLPPDDQQSIRDGWNQKHHPEPPAIGFQPQPAAQGPVLTQGERPVGLPFPGSLSVSCSISSVNDFAKGPCGLPVPGQVGPPRVPETGKPAEKGSPFSVDATLTGTRSTGDPVVDENGVRRTTMGMTTDLRVTGKADGTDKKGTGLELSGYLGHSSTYELSTQSDRAGEIADGDAPAPTPADPRTLHAGDSIQLREEDYRGAEGTASYRALQAGLDYTTGERVSAGVQRVDGNTTRIYVGNEDVVENALKLGVGSDDLGVALSFSNEFADGKLRSVDLDLSTKAGWDTYQRFVNEGRLPAVDKPDTPGVEDAADADTASWSGGATLDAKAWKAELHLGGTSVEGNVTESHHTDGRVDNTMTARNGDVTLLENHTRNPDGTEEPSSYGLTLKDVDKSYIGPLEQINGGSGTDADDDQDMRLNFTDGQLEQLRHEALERIRYGQDQAGQPMSMQEIEDATRGNPYSTVTTGAGPSDDSLLRSIAAARYPREVLGALYTQAHGNSNEVVDFLLSHHMAMGMVDKSNPLEQDAPGDVVVYGPADR
jgi:hypothetical protein